MDQELSTPSLRAQALSRSGAALRRSHLEIKMDILDAIKAGADKPTQIMYKANLSWVALQEHLDALTKGGLIRVVEYGSRKKYELTEKAINLIVSYRKIIEEIQGPIENSIPRF